ncbi:hypothetical protein PtrM4_111830 [Pyrenophora tritici-repentis]|uniref:Uncharacterized protein n=1 Tax=Pyrenophora tritici-repentis TaxID=45151 RepID=A0A317A7Y4_9PLEO|nr:hypothetical protein PtrM4_111830 [Pyrenophora tritici-repentis]
MTNADTPPDLAEVVVTLQAKIQRFMKDAKDGKYWNKVSSGGMTTIGNRVELERLDEQLQIIERQLVSRGAWRPPTQLSTPLSPEVLEMADLSHAVALLRNLIEPKGSAQETTPRLSLSAYSWVWDPVWHEFYTYIPSERTFLSLSRWKLNEARNVWEHVSQASTNILPNAAAEKLGAWEDWKWHPVWGWYLDLEDEGSGEKAKIFASPWQVDDDDEWVYVGTLGQEDH